MPPQDPPRKVSRIVPQPKALRALAHPERLRILGLLRIEGPATASGLARRLGLNSGATSYHLRQLAAHGFIEPADELGNRRERWWRSRHESTTYDTTELSGDDFAAGMAFTQVVLSQHVAQMQRAYDRFADLPLEWRKASNESDFTIALTADEAKALVERIMDLLWAAKAAAPPPDAPLAEGMRQFTVLLHAFPYPETPRDGDA